MTAEQWWVVQPPHIKMTDSRARALLIGQAETKNNDEWVFVQANASTIIPPKEAIKIVPADQRLSLHHPNQNAVLVYGEKD